MTGLLWGARSYTLSRTRGDRVALCGGRAAVSVLGIAPSPQPSPPGGEGVWPCGVWSTMQLQPKNQSAPRGHHHDARPAASIRQAADNQTTSLLRPTPSSPRPSGAPGIGERARVRGNVFQATQESQK